MPDASANMTTAPPPGGETGSLHGEVIQFFVNLSQGLGLPKSVGEIFGALYCSPAPLSFNDLIDQTGTSKASVSQGLRALKKINAIRAVNVPNDRRTYYSPELQFRPLIGGFLRETIEPQLRRGANHLTQLQNASPDDPFLNGRIDGLREWNREAAKLLRSPESEP